MVTFNPGIFKAYDIRGIYGEDLDDELAYFIGQGYAKVIQPKGKIAVGMDVRICSPALKKALIEGLTDAGVDVVDVGLISTEMIYFATGFYGYAGGIQVTASHNPPEWGGFKMVKEDAAPISSDNGIFDVRDFAEKKEKITGAKKGIVEIKDIVDDFAKHCLTFINKDNIKPLKVVDNPNFGLQGQFLKTVIKAGNLPIEVVGINDTPDGTFPKGRPDPFVPENRPEFVELVKSSHADLGVAWDADADRVFFCTGSGIFVDCCYINAVLIEYLLKKNPGSSIVYEPRYTLAILDATKENGGTAVPARVGHSFIKAKMRENDAIFCGESSGHTYLRDFYYADSGMIPFLMVLELISTEGKSLDEILKPYFEKYFISGEINQRVSDTELILKKIEEKYADSQISKLDGISIDYPEWRANIRPSNTEPLLRMNVESKDKKLMEEKRDEILEMIRQ